MKILVFVSKLTGLKLLDIFFDRFNDDDYLFVVSDPDSEKIIQTITMYGHKYMLLNDSTIDWINDKDERSFDWLLNLWGGYIFKENLISKAKKTLNIHPSFLPYGRGRDPIVWAIRYGYPAGVTLHEISTSVDDGPILYQEEVSYNFPITGGQLYNQVIEKCFEVFTNKWPLIRDDNTSAIAQSDKKGYKTFKRKDLYNDNVINLDNDDRTKDLLLRFLCHDFGDNYSVKLLYKGNYYSLRLLIEKIELEVDNE